MITTVPVTMEDEEQRRAGDVLKARVYLFEDGQSRHFTAKARYWQSLDGLLNAGWKVEQVLWVPFDTARDRVQANDALEFEAELRACVDQFLRMAWAYLPENKRQRVIVSTQTE